MIQVISYSLFGTDNKYTQGAIINAKLAKQYMPDWEVWIWHNKTVPVNIIKQLNNMDNVKLFHCLNEKYPMTASRFLALEKADVVIFRDVDDRLSARGIVAVSEWLSSGLKYHIIKDHPQGHSALMMAGMWGSRSNDLKHIELLMNKYFDKDINIDRNSDQQFLADVVYPMIKGDVLYHSEHYTPKIEGNSKVVGFSTVNNYPTNYIGAALLANNYFAYESDNLENNHKPYEYDFVGLESK